MKWIFADESTKRGLLPYDVKIFKDKNGEIRAEFVGYFASIHIEESYLSDAQISLLENQEK